MNYNETISWVVLTQNKWDKIVFFLRQVSLGPKRSFIQKGSLGKILLVYCCLTKPYPPLPSSLPSIQLWVRSCCTWTGWTASYLTVKQCSGCTLWLDPRQGICAFIFTTTSHIKYNLWKKQQLSNAVCGLTKWQNNHKPLKKSTTVTLSAP